MMASKRYPYALCGGDKPLLYEDDELCIRGFRRQRAHEQVNWINSVEKYTTDYLSGPWNLSKEGFAEMQFMMADGHGLIPNVINEIKLPSFPGGWS